jgi:transposase IS3/IS911 family protein
MVKYSKEFKEQALLLSDEIGVKKAAEQLGINYSTLADWRKTRNRKAKEERIASDKSPLNERELALYKEIQELKKANEILKDALGFFVVDRKK